MMKQIYEKGTEIVFVKDIKEQHPLAKFVLFGSAIMDVTKNTTFDNLIVFNAYKFEAPYTNNIQILLEV